MGVPIGQFENSVAFTEDGRVIIEGRAESNFGGWTEDGLVTLHVDL